MKWRAMWRRKKKLCIKFKQKQHSGCSGKNKLRRNERKQREEKSEKPD